MPHQPRLVFLLDVDNTLIDNDAAKQELDARLGLLLGRDEASRFWSIYEEVRRDAGVISYPITLARFHDGLTGDEARERQFAVADLVMTFPYDRFLFPDAMATISHLQTLGRVAILSDGDPAYQPCKIARSGLSAAVDGFVFVYPHKQEHLDEVAAAFPADGYVLVEDKPGNIADVRARLRFPLATILVQQGKYAAQVGPGQWSGADLTLARLGDLRQLNAAAFTSAMREPGERSGS